MDWPTWSDIAPMLATVVGLLVALLAGSWALGGLDVSDVPRRTRSPR